MIEVGAEFDEHGNRIKYGTAVPTSMGMWQPIETAPRDGKALDLWVVCVDLAWRPDGEAVRITDARWADGKWVFDLYDDNEPVEDERYKAVYWMRVEPPDEWRNARRP